MAKHKSLSNHEIKRSVIREDVLFFAIPALVIYTAGLIVSAWDGYDGLLSTLLGLVGQPQKLYLFSIYNILGLAIFILGLTIALVGVFTLGHFYSSSLVTRHDHQLITHGIYRFVRHPIYFGALLACLGTMAYAASLYGFLIMLALIPVVLYRIRLEDNMLVEEFGDQYRIYQETTSKLVPFIY